MIDVSADEGWLATVLRTTHLVQMVVQGRWLHDCSLLTLPGIETAHLPLFKVPRDCSSATLQPGTFVECLPELLDVVGGKKHLLVKMLHEHIDPRDVDQVRSWTFSHLVPLFRLSFCLIFLQNSVMFCFINTAKKVSQKLNCLMLKCFAKETHVFHVIKVTT